MISSNSSNVLKTACAAAMLFGRSVFVAVVEEISRAVARLDVQAVPCVIQVM